LPFAFEDFVLDVARRELRRGGDPVAIEPKVFDLLVHLVANRERVVTKDDLIGAVWDGRIVSESALTTAVNAARVVVGDSGGAQRLIKTLPRKGFRFVGLVREHEAAGTAATGVATAAPKALPDKPSIAVLPFNNMSGDPEQDYFADGVVEDIITNLSRIRWLFVIARNSSFTYKGRAVDIKQVGRELGVRYVLEGSIRKSGKRIRVTAQLIDASVGTHLWADRFDGALEDVFELQDQLTARVVGAIAPKLEQAEIERAKSKPTENLGAYDIYLRGMANFRKWTREGNEEALRLFYKAIELDPEFPTPYAAAAMCFQRRKGFGWLINRDQEVAEVRRLARRVMQLGKSDATALCQAGATLAYVAKELDDGVALIDRALVLNPNLALAWGFSGWSRVWLGKTDLAIEHFAHAMRLSPVDPYMFWLQEGTAHAHFFAGRYDEALAWAQMALRDLPDSHAALRIGAASNALAGRGEEAKRLTARLLEIDPTLRISSLLSDVLGPYRQPEHPTKYASALRKAGLPE
jgi:TolB-like protein/Tfp pilus assembly protein PilF